MKTIQTIFAAAVVAVSLSACHSYANDNTSRSAIPDENGHHIGNCEIEANFSAGSDTNPNSVMWDGITSSEEHVGDKSTCCDEKCEKECKEQKEEGHSGHDSH